MNTEGYPVAVPFVGNYTEEKIKKAMQILKEDFAGFDAQLIIMDVVPWMLPYYEASGIQFEIEDNRDYMDYTLRLSSFWQVWIRRMTVTVIIISNADLHMRQKR